ncbi:MAG: hypothetical protein ACOYKA_04325 [Legionellaceae bacterium]
MLDRINKNYKVADRSTLISEKSWVLDIHPDWYLQPWGQNKRYLPPALREIAQNLYHNYPDENLMNFGMVKHIFEEQRRQLRESGIDFIEEHADSIEQKKDGSLVALVLGKERLICETPNFHITHAARRPISPDELAVRNFGDSYREPKEKTNQPIVIVGSGVSLNWGCRDNESLRPVIHLIPPGDRSRLDLKRSLDGAFHMSDCSIDSSSKDTVVIEGINALTGLVSFVQVKPSHIFSAMGYELDKKLVKVPQGKVTELDGSPKPEAVVTAHAVTSGQRSRKAMDYRGTNVPDGNLGLNHLKIKLSAGEYVASEQNAILLFDAWKKTVSELAVDAGIEINPEFFDIAEHRIKSIYSLRVPPEEQVYQVLKSAYEKAGGMKDKDGSEVSWDVFLTFIRTPMETPTEEESPGLGPK